MSDEKHPDRGCAAEKLEGLDILPGETPLDKPLAWEKLYSRVRQKQNRKIRRWYPLVAASVLCALVIYGITGLHTGREPVKHDTKKTRAIDPAGQQQPVRKADPGEAEVFAVKTNTAIRGIPLLHPHKGRVRSLPRNNPFTAVPDLIPDTVVPASKSDLPGPEASALVMNHSTTAGTAPPIAKKKLRVVHMNELDEPAEADDNLVKNSGRHGFRLKWIGQPGSSNTFQETDHSNNELIRINLPSPN